MTLRDWQKERLKTLRGMVFQPSRHNGAVTLVAYSFPSDADSDSFDWLECAIRQSWSVLGLLKTVLVLNRRFAKADAFAAAFPEWIDVQIESSLKPGEIETMSADCNGRLYKRFLTPYCLVVQDDGFPLWDRLDEFLGKFDFVGAPYVRLAWWREIICSILGMWVSNGGFSLRSRRICEAAARYWERKWNRSHPREATVDDLYYTRTLPLKYPLYRFRFRIAGIRAALRFSYDDIVKQPVAEQPMGFHRASTFETLQKSGFAQIQAQTC